MHSISKTAVSMSMVEEIIADAFGSQAEIHAFQELTDGYFNAAYLIELAGGLRCVLKVAPPDSVRVLRYEQHILHAEVAVLRLVKRHTSVPVPDIYWYDSSRRILGSPFFIMEFVPGEPFHKLRATLDDAARAAIEHEIGGYLRQMNDIAGHAFGYIAPGAVQHHSWRDAFIHMLDNVLADGQDMRVVLPTPYDRLREQVAQCAAALDDVTTPRLIHWDLWDGNVFVDPVAGRISGIIDFERALWGDPLMEFSFRALEEPSAFSAGYGRTMLDTASARRRRILYNIYLYLIMIIECTYRQFETQDQERWSRQQFEQEMARLEAECAAV